MAITLSTRFEDITNAKDLIEFLEKGASWNNGGIPNGIAEEFRRWKRRNDVSWDVIEVKTSKQSSPYPQMSTTWTITVTFVDNRSDWASVPSERGDFRSVFGRSYGNSYWTYESKVWTATMVY